MFDHAEIALHENYGDKTYWKARRSMRFAAPLIREAKLFRKLKLNSTDRADKISRPDDWQNEKVGNKIIIFSFLLSFKSLNFT